MSTIPAAFYRRSGLANSLIVAALCLLLMVSCALAHPPPGVETISTENAMQDARILKRALNELHPGLTKYQTEAEWLADQQQFDAEIAKATTVTDLYLAASKLAASIRCGHTWTNVLNQEGPIKVALLEKANKLPFKVMWVENRFLVISSADANVPVGADILRINGQTPTEIRDRLWPYLRADGNSDSKRLRQISHDRFDYSQMDILWPLLSPPKNGRWQIEFQDRGRTQQVTVAAVSFKTRQDRLAGKDRAPDSEAWTFRTDGDLAIMTLPTFSFYNSDFDWQAFFTTHFAELNAKNVPNLVIDLRLNEGGDGAIAAALVQHVLHAPVKIRSEQSATRYERVPYILAKYLDTWDFSFFDRTGQVRPITDGPQQGMLEFLPKAKGEQTFAPLEPNYRGRVFVLISGENSSAGFMAAQLFRMAGTATLVGQTTGGNQRGLNGGQLTWVTLPNSGVSVDIPLLAGRFNASTPDAAIEPDVLVARHFEAQRNGVDEELAAVRLEIAKKPAD